jgi:hypothetical protein
MQADRIFKTCVSSVLAEGVFEANSVDVKCSGRRLQARFV